MWGRVKKMNRLVKNKKGQIGETMTWVIATIIIIVVLIVSIFITSFLGTIGLHKNYKSYRSADLIPMKSLIGYLLTSDLEGSGKNIFDKLKDDEEFIELNGENGRFAWNIFNGFYESDYPLIWFGISNKRNDYFKGYEQTAARELQTKRVCIQNAIKLEKETANLLLCP